jgi:hypothetical protein
MKMYLPPPGRRDTRRGFLKKGLLGGLVLALGGSGWLAFKRGARVRLPEGMQVLNERDYALVQALIQRLVPRRQGFPDPDVLETAKAFDHILTQVDDSARMELKQLMMLFENALPAFLFGARTQPFTQLSVDEQERVLTEWRDSRIVLRRSGYVALRTIIMGAYYGNPAVWPAVKYPGPPPGVYDPNAPLWKGEGPRPVGNGTFLDLSPTPAPPVAGRADAGVSGVQDGGVK